MCQPTHNRSSRRRKREGEQKYVLGINGLKLPTPKEGNRYLTTGSTEGLTQDELTQTQTKIYRN